MSAAFAPTRRSRTASPSGASLTTCARAPPLTPSRSPRNSSTAASSNRKPRKRGPDILAELDAERGETRIDARLFPRRAPVIEESRNWSPVGDPTDDDQSFAQQRPRDARNKGFEGLAAGNAGDQEHKPHQRIAPTFAH